MKIELDEEQKQILEVFVLSSRSEMQGVSFDYTIVKDYCESIYLDPIETLKVLKLLL